MERTTSSISTHARTLSTSHYDAGLDGASSNYPIAQPNLDKGRRTSRTFPPSFTTRGAQTVDPSTTSLKSPVEGRKFSYAGIVSYRDDPAAAAGNVDGMSAAVTKDDNPFSDEHETAEAGQEKRVSRKYSDYASSPTAAHARKPSAGTHNPWTCSTTAAPHPDPTTTGLSNSVLSAGEPSGSSSAVHTKDWAENANGSGSGTSYTLMGREHSINPAHHVRQGSSASASGGHGRSGSGSFSGGGGDRRRSSTAQGILGALKEYIKPAAPEGRFD